MELLVDNNLIVDDFLKTRFISGNFLQSSWWRDFLKIQGKNFWQIVVVENNETIASCLLYENILPLGRSYLYAPKGPIVSYNISENARREAMALILSKARDITAATKKRAEIFLKVEPIDSSLILADLKKADDIQPRETWALDLDKDIKELLGLMHAKTRYNIALARKKGVGVRFSQKPDDLKHFLELIGKTAERNQISVHSADYYKKLFEILVKYGTGGLYLAEINKQVIAANIVVRFGEVVTYVHGASDYNFRSSMAPHLLQWEAIRESQSLGYKFYDFWGVAPSDGSRPRWEGFTRFKKSFGGRLLVSPGAYNLIYNPTWYRLYSLSSQISHYLKK